MTAPTAVPALPAARQRPEVEALRGLAATAVLASHSWGIGHDYSVAVFSTRWGRLGLAGGGGVALFFALSGYLLTRLLMGTSRPPTLGRYLRHRAARILPTWWFVLAFMLLLHDEDVAARHWWRFPLLVQGFWTDTVGRVDGPAWTLALEAQFYLLLPLLAVLLRRSARTAWVTLAVLAVAGTAVNVLTVATGHATTVWRYGLAANACYFVPGIALAVLEARTDISTRLGRVPHPRAVLLGLSLPFWLSFVPFPRTSLLTAVAAGLTVTAVALPLGEGRAVRLLRSRVLVVLGTLSFGTYLWHEPLLRVAHAHGVTQWWALLAVVLPTTLLLAAATHLLVERPALRQRDADWRAWTPDLRRIAAGGAGALAVAAVALVT